MADRKRPNVVLILNDDMGFSDLGCYGGEIRTPSLDSLAAGGLRYTQFYNTARCCPSRASLLTGLHPHQAGVGHMMHDDGVDGYMGDLAQATATIAEVLRPAGYRTYMAGKWHVSRHIKPDNPSHNWPCQRGFDRYYGTLTGACNYFNPHCLRRDNEPITAGDADDYYFTDDISDRACEFVRDHAADHADQPFFAYVAYTAPHWPLHAPEEDIARCAGRFSAGWDRLRRERLERMVEMGLIDRSWKLSPRDPSQSAWDETPDHEWQQRRMEVYAAQVDRMDQGIGRIVQALRETGQLDNTLILFLADNGGCAEELQADEPRGQDQGTPSKTRAGQPVKWGNTPACQPGSEETYASYGLPWANLSNTPFRRYKHWVHEGGIATPLIAHWPTGIAARGELRLQPGQLPDIMATICDVTGADYPAERDGHAVPPCEGFSLRPTFIDSPSARPTLFWEHEGNKAVREGRWKLVRRFPLQWELYDIEADRTELTDLSAESPEVVKELSAKWRQWADRVGVVDWEQLRALRRSRA